MNEYEVMSCYYCGEEVHIDGNNLDINEKECYWGDDKYRINIITCPKHSHNGYIN